MSISTDYLKNTLIEIQDVFNNTIEPVLNDLQVNSISYDAIFASYSKILSDLNNLLTYIDGNTIKGDQGIQGEKGDQGIQGIQGEKGDQGIQGIQGEKGDQGIQGIQGEKGDQGVQGIQGIQGEKGLDGVSVLKSITKTSLGAFTTTLTTLSEFYNIVLPKGFFYEISVKVPFSTVATTTGLKLDIELGAINDKFFEIKVPITTAQNVSTLVKNTMDLSSLFVTGTAVSAINTKHVAEINGFADCVTSPIDGEIHLMFASEVSGSKADILAGTIIIVKQYTLS